MLTDSRVSMLLRDGTTVIVVFDGECGLCSRFVRFALRHNSSRTLKFVPSHSDTGRELLERFTGQSELRDSMVVIEREIALTYSDGALAVIKQLDSPYDTMRVATLIPRPLRDLGYRFVAKIRYKIFGRARACAPLSEEERGGIIE